MGVRPGSAPSSDSASTPGRAVFVSSPGHRTGSLILKGDTEKDKNSKEFFSADPENLWPCPRRPQDAGCRGAVGRPDRVKFCDTYSLDEGGAAEFPETGTFRGAAVGLPGPHAAIPFGRRAGKSPEQHALSWPLGQDGGWSGPKSIRKMKDRPLPLGPQAVLLHLPVKRGLPHAEFPCRFSDVAAADFQSMQDRLLFHLVQPEDSAEPVPGFEVA